MNNSDKPPLSPNLKTDGLNKSTAIRVQFSRKGATSYVAHLDMMRIFERSLKRAGIDCEYSQGFNPRPVMAFALPLGVGVETTGDYVDIVVKDDIQPLVFVNRLKQALPAGIDIIGAAKPPKAKESMMAQVVAAQYLFISPGIANAVIAAYKNPSILVMKTSKGVTKEIDIKPLIISIDEQSPDSIKVTVKAGSKNNLRPDLLLEALADEKDFTTDDAKNTRIIRTGTLFAHI